MSAAEALPAHRALPPLTDEQRARVLRALDALRRPRPLRIVRRRPTYRIEDRTIPTPPALRGYVRDDRHFARIAGALVERTGRVSGAGAFRGERLACARDILTIWGGADEDRSLALGDPLASDLLLLLFPPVPCAVCGRPFLRENARRACCSDACRRRTARANEQPALRSVAPERPCAACGETIPAGRMPYAIYCGERCATAAAARRKLARNRARRATSAPPCPICGGALGPGFVRYCSRPCRDEGERRERAAAVRAKRAALRCRVCGGGLGLRQHRYCSPDCATAAERDARRARRGLAAASCPVCGGATDGRRRSAVYCGAACHRAAKIARQRAERARRKAAANVG